MSLGVLPGGLDLTFFLLTFPLHLYYNAHIRDFG